MPTSSPRLAIGRLEGAGRIAMTRPSSLPAQRGVFVPAFNANEVEITVSAGKTVLSVSVGPPSPFAFDEILYVGEIEPWSSAPMGGAAIPWQEPTFADPLVKLGAMVDNQSMRLTRQFVVSLGKGVAETVYRLAGGAVLAPQLLVHTVLHPGRGVIIRGWLIENW